MGLGGSGTGDEFVVAAVGKQFALFLWFGGRFFAVFLGRRCVGIGWDGRCEDE